MGGECLRDWRVRRRCGGAGRDPQTIDHSEGHRRRGHLQQRQISAQQMENGRTYLPQRPRLVKRQPLPPKQGSPPLRGRYLAGDPGGDQRRACSVLALGRRRPTSHGLPVRAVSDLQNARDTQAALSSLC